MDSEIIYVAIGTNCHGERRNLFYHQNCSILWWKVRDWLASQPSGYWKGLPEIEPLGKLP